MMKYRRTIILALFAALIGFSPIAQAQQPSGQLKPGDSQIFSSVELNCISTKLQLTKIHESDALLRVTLGQTFESISTKLMARMNTRIVQSKLDGTLLVRDTADFERTLNAFRTDYKTYDNAMGDLLQLGCEGNEQTFYINLQTVRRLRAAVNTDVAQLHTIITQYRENFKKFRQDLEKEHVE